MWDLFQLTYRFNQLYQDESLVQDLVSILIESTRSKSSKLFKISKDHSKSKSFLGYISKKKISTIGESLFS